ncbi:MAG: SRPBCC domain-containing protein [Tepidisphaeraceae bacterium]
MSEASKNDRELVITRTIDAPPERVFNAWTQRLKEWWGPHGMTTPVCEMDLKAGGALRTVMRDPEGNEYPTRGVFLEVTEPQRIVFTDAFDPGWEPHPDAFFTAVTTFDPLPGGKTKYTARALHWTSENRKKHEEMGFYHGWGESIDRLVALATYDGKEFVITREFDAPRELVWKAWTERERMMEWFGPKGFTMSTATLDFRPGGVFHYCLRGPDGMEMWGKFTYREIVPQERLVWINAFSDAKGGLGRHPMAPDWPQQMLTTTTFTEKDGKTIVTIRWIPIDATPEERKTFEAGRDGMKMGWTGTFEQLTAYLAKARG